MIDGDSVMVGGRDEWHQLPRVGAEQLPTATPIYNRPAYHPDPNPQPAYALDWWLASALLCALAAMIAVGVLLVHSAMPTVTA